MGSKPFTFWETRLLIYKGKGSRDEKKENASEWGRERKRERTGGEERRWEEGRGERDCAPMDAGTWAWCHPPAVCL